MTSKILYAEQAFRYLYDVTFWGILTYAIQAAVIKESPSVSVICYIAGAFLCSLLIRNLAPNNAVMLVLHILLVGILIWMPGAVWIRTVTGFVICIYLLPVSASFIKRGYRSAPLSEPWPSMLAVILLYIAGSYAHYETFANLAYAASMIMMSDYLLIHYLQGLKRYTEQTTDVSGLPVRTVVTVNSRIVSGLIICLLLLMIACRFLNLDFLVRWVASGLFFILNIIVTGIAIVYIFFLTLLTKGGADVSDLSVQEELENYTASYEVSHVADIIVEIFAVLILLFLCYKGILAVVHFLTCPRVIKEQKETNAKRRESNVKRQRLAAVGGRSRRAEYDRVRNAYRKMVVRYKEKVPLNSYRTSGDIRTDIKEQGVDTIDAATDLYESVRYGHMPAGQEQIKEMERLTKKHRKVSKGTLIKSEFP